MNVRIFKKHKTQNRFFDFLQKTWVEGSQIRSVTKSRGVYSPKILIIDFEGRDITERLGF